MLNDLQFKNNIEKVNASITLAKDIFGENLPYVIESNLKGKYAVFSDHFIAAIRETLKTGCIAKMNEQEILLFNKFIAFQKDGLVRDITNPENFIIQELDKWFQNEVAVIDAVTVFSDGTPYRIFPTSVSPEDEVIAFPQRFIDVFRLVLSGTDSLSIIQMSPAERNIYYAYLDFQNGVTITDAELLRVVTKLDSCIVNEVQCKAETYLEAAFNQGHTWSSCFVRRETPTLINLRQEEYDVLVGYNRIKSNTIYKIELLGATVKIYIGDIVVWTL